MDCLDDDTVLAFVQGQLTRDRTARVHDHLRGCSSCHIVVAEAAKYLFPEETSPEGAPTPAARPAAPEPPPALAPGASVSRYVIEAPLGTGATGVVYRAWDPQLKRKVALKLLRPGSDPERLLREAEAMARLSHPNVVNVFDAGTYHELVFIVMELVEGETLAAWLHRPRSWPEIVGAFVEAGRGLAAAHAAGLVHRDFKPENVLAGADGRVRVTDFGLARPLAAVGQLPGPAPVAPGAAHLTAPAGTPIYMAPEQLLGTGADARSDQFSFCVSLLLALGGRHPLGVDGPNLLDVARKLEGAQLAALRGAEALPAPVRDLLARGLDVDPARRHPSMQALVEALEGAVRAGRRPRLAAATIAAGLAAAATLAIWQARSASAPTCGDGKAEGTEACDDGNRTDEDACLSSCQWARCGDGKLRAGVEECDDGNAVTGDGCSAACLVCRTGDASFAWDATGRCYSRHDRPLPWPAARAACEAGGGSLVTYTSSYESRAVWSALFSPAAALGPSWIGLYSSREGPPGGFGWVTGETVPKLYWAPGEPRPGSGTCVWETPSSQLNDPAALFAAGLWSAGDCSRSLPFVCEQGGWTIRASDHHAYRIFLRPVKWPEAQRACRALGGDLATIREADEQDFVAAQAAYGFWIGATDGPREGTFTWSSGEPFALRRFAPGEPDDAWDTDDCVLFGADDLWHDRRCDHEHPYMCEIGRGTP